MDHEPLADQFTFVTQAMIFREHHIGRRLKTPTFLAAELVNVWQGSMLMWDGNWWFTWDLDFDDLITGKYNDRPYAAFPIDEIVLPHFLCREARRAFATPPDPTKTKLDGGSILTDGTVAGV